MPLFHIQDGDRPMYVKARDGLRAVELWEAKIREENDIPSNAPVESCMGVALLCPDEDFLMSPGEGLQAALKADAQRKA